MRLRSSVVEQGTHKPEVAGSSPAAAIVEHVDCAPGEPYAYVEWGSWNFTPRCTLCDYTGTERVIHSDARSAVLSHVRTAAHKRRRDAGGMPDRQTGQALSSTGQDSDRDIERQKPCYQSFPECPVL
jgi:hypothetical protein